MLLQRESAVERWDWGGEETALQARLALATGDFPTFVAATAMRGERVEVARLSVAWAADDFAAAGQDGDAIAIRAAGTELLGGPLPAADPRRSAEPSSAKNRHRAE